ncbi:MAG: lipopolysaccharide assembly protein LapA domain-containing protein [Chitinispirillaceae bacterium]
MKILKWIVVFAVAFMAAWVLIFTFNQKEFSESVPVIILGYRTTAIPIYAFVAGSFGIGLLIGILAAAYYYLIGQSNVRKKKKEMKQLEDELIYVKSELDLYKSRDEARGKQDESQSDSSEDNSQV